MLNLPRRYIPMSTERAPSPTRAVSVSSCREALRNINWKLIVFCVALWWFIYSAPTEGILTSHFWSASNATNSDDF